MEPTVELTCPHCSEYELVFEGEGDTDVCAYCDDAFILQSGEATFLEKEEYRAIVLSKLDAMSEHIETILRRPISEALEDDPTVKVCQCGCRNDIAKLALRNNRCNRCGRPMDEVVAEVKETPHMNGLVHGVMHAVDVLSANDRTTNEIAAKAAEHITVGELMAEQTLFCCRIGIKCVWCNPQQQAKLNI